MYYKPTRVGFGPFDSGFLNASEGLGRISPRRTKDGIQLPTGVKTLQTQKEGEDRFLKEPWSNDEDEQLKDVVSKHSLNWYIASRAVSSMNYLS